MREMGKLVETGMLEEDLGRKMLLNMVAERDFSLWE